MARHSAALTSEGDVPPQSRPSRSRGLNLVDERGRPVFDEQYSFGLGFALVALILGVILAALLLTGKIGQPSLRVSEPPLPLPSTPAQLFKDERLPAEALERAQVVNARLSAPVTVSAGPVSAPTPSTSITPEVGVEGANRPAPKQVAQPASEAEPGDNPY